MCGLDVVAVPAPTGIPVPSACTAISQVVSVPPAVQLIVPVVSVALSSVNPVISGQDGAVVKSIGPTQIPKPLVSQSDLT